MTLQNKYLFQMVAWFNSLSLIGYQSRMRTKFSKILFEQAQKVEQERKEILESYAKKGEDGQFIIVKDEKGLDSYDLAEDDVQKFKAEYEQLQNNNAIFVVDDSNKEIFDTIKRIIADTDTKIGPEFANAYDAFCESLEKVA